MFFLKLCKSDGAVGVVFVMSCEYSMCLVL